MLAFLVCALGSALYVLGYAGFDLWPLACIALVPVLYAVDRMAKSGAHALALGLCFGTLVQLGGTSWLVPTLRDFSGLPLWACVLAFALLSVYQGGQLALFVWLCDRVKRAGRSLLAFAPLCFGAAELVYPMLFPSPFGASLHAQPVLFQLAELGGPTLVSMLLVSINGAAFGALLFLFGRGPLPRRVLLVTALATAGALGYGVVRMRQIDARIARAPKLTLGLVQANLGSWQKREQRAEGRRRHLAQSKALEHGAQPDLLVWPETALHYLVPVPVKSLSPWLGPLSTPVLLGALGHRVQDGRAELYNSAFLAAAGGRVLGRADKQRLVPFAEYMPLGDRVPQLYELSRGSGQFTPGPASPTLSFRGHRIAVLICYEDVLANYVREVVRHTDPHLLVDISNDSWFGESREPRIHLALSKLRAVEHRRFLARAGNVGVSAVVDPAGRVTARIPPFTRANLVAEVALLAGQTPYAHLGNWIGWLALLVTVWACVRPKPYQPL